jgi:hypothetical protein
VGQGLPGWRGSQPVRALGLQRLLGRWRLRHQAGHGHTGKLCARLVCRQKGRGGIGSEAIGVAAGSKLHFKGWFKALGASGGTCRVNFEGEPGDGFASVPLRQEPDYDWTEVASTIAVPVPKGKKAGDVVEVLVFIYIQTYGELWIDDVSLTPAVD